MNIILKEIRRRSGLSSRAMAQMLGMRHTTYYELEIGKRIPADETSLLRRVAVVARDLNLDLYEIFQNAVIDRTGIGAVFTPQATIDRILESAKDLHGRGEGTIVAPAYETDRFLALARRAAETMGLKLGDKIPLLPTKRLSHNSFGWIDDPSLVTFLTRPGSKLGSTPLYAIRVIASSMEPRYELNDVVIAQPDAPIKPGDDCVLSRSADEGTISNIIRVGAFNARHIQVKQINAKPETFIVPANRATLHRIVSVEELLQA